MPQARRRPAEVRQLILTTAERLFADKGYAVVTAEEIAAEAGVTRSVFYRHFGNKTELFQAAVVSPFLEFVGSYRTALKPRLHEGDVEQLMSIYCNLFYDSMCRHRSAVLALVSAINGALPDDATDEVRRLFDGFFDELVAIAEEEARTMGVLPIKNLEMSIRLVLGMVASVSVMDVMFVSASHPPPRSELIEALTRIGLHGMEIEGLPPQGTQ